MFSCPGLPGSQSFFVLFSLRSVSSPYVNKALTLELAKVGAGKSKKSRARSLPGQNIGDVDIRYLVYQSHDNGERTEPSLSISDVENRKGDPLCTFCLFKTAKGYFMI